MSRAQWSLIKQSKHFYVGTYRGALTALFISISLNLLLGFAVYYTYFNQPESDFYATNGVTAPVELNPMSKPNTSSNPLLKSVPTQKEENKAIPN